MIFATKTQGHKEMQFVVEAFVGTKTLRHEEMQYGLLDIQSFGLEQQLLLEASGG